ncbi:hypothetical protein ABPG74_007091 [Tetrahymena malaccensis]
MKKAEQHIRSLLEKTIDLDELEIEINKLKPRFSQIDEELVQQIQQKYNDGREIQQSCRNIIQSALENEFTEEGIKTIEVFIKDAKKLNLDLPEFHRLETVKLIPKWVNRLHTIVCDTFGANRSASKEGNTQSQQNSQGGSGNKKEPKVKKQKPLRTLRQEIMKGLDSLEPSKMTPQLKQDLIDALSKNMPQVLDEELNKLLQKVQLILWIKDAYDLLGKESIALADLVLLKDNPIKIDTSFKHLKFKQATYHKQIVDLISQQETWMSKATQIETKYPMEEINSDRSKFEQFKKAIETLKKGMNAKIEKITEVKDKFTAIQQQQLQIEWAVECGEFLRNDSERKKLEDLESYYRRAESCKVSKQWSTLQALEALYTQVKELIVKSKKLMNNQSNQEKMDIEKDKDTPEIIDYEKKQKEFSSKVTIDEVDQLLERMKNLNDRVNFDSQIEFLELSKKSQEKYIQLITRCYNAHWSQMDNFQDTPSEDLLSIRTQIQEISKLEKNILVALPKFDSYFMKLQWSIDCAFFLSSSSSIQMKRDLEECKKLVNASAVVKDIENSKLCKKLNEQLNMFLKCKDAVDQLRKDSKKKKADERESLISMQQFNELENALRTITIEESQAQFKEVQKMKRKLEQIIAEYDQATQKNEKQPLKFWKDLLEQFHNSKIPVKCDEECMLEVLIKNAEEMEQVLKANKKQTGSASKKGSSNQQQLSQEIIELLERYRLQQVKIPEAEKLIEKWKIKEDALSVIEKKVYSNGEAFNFQEILDLQVKLNSLKSEFKGERVQKIDQELYLKKILMLKQYWDKNQEIDSTYEQMKETLEKIKQKFEGRTESRFSQAIQFVEDVIEQCEQRIQKIEEITNPKELELSLKQKFKQNQQSLKFVRYVDMSQQIVDKLARLKIDIEKQKQLDSEKKQKEKQLAKEKQLEEERKLKAQNDARLSKKKEIEDKKREIEDKHKEKIVKEKKQNEKLKQNMISDLSKAINETWKSLTLQECLQYGTIMVDRLYLENSNSTSATLDSVLSFAKLFLEMKKLPNLCQQVKKLKFDSKELNRLIKLLAESKKSGKDLLLKEEKMIEINKKVSENENNLILDIKLKKKDVPLEQGPQIEGSVPTKKFKSENIALSLLFNDRINPKDKNEDSSYVNVDENNLVKQSIAKIRQEKLSTLKPGTKVQKQKQFGQKFSDDEDDGQEDDQEYVPLREEDFQSLNESLLLQHNKLMKENQNKFWEFNPDEENLSQRQDEAPENASVVSLFKGSFEIQMPNNEQPFVMNKIYILSCNDANECQNMPAYPNKNFILSMKGVLGLNNFTQYYNQLAQETKLNPERKIRFVSGWFESENAEDRPKLENYANQLKFNKRVAVIEWTPECKLYILHRDQWNIKGNQGFEIKFKRNFFHQSSHPNDTLLYIMIFKQHKLANQKDYETLRPIHMQKRFLPQPPQNQMITSPPLKAHQLGQTESGKKLQKILNNYNPPTQSTSNNIFKQGLQAQADLDNSFQRGKKSFQKMSLESLARNSEFITEEEEKQRLNEKLLGIKNQIANLENKLINQTNPNNYQQNKKVEPTFQQHHQNNQQHNSLIPPHLKNQQNQQQLNQPSSYQQQQQQSVHQQQQQLLQSRYNTAQKLQSNYPRSANRSGVNTPNYYEQKFGSVHDEVPNYGNHHLNQSFQQQNYNKPAYQRTLDFNGGKANESMDVEDYNMSFRGSLFNSQQSQSQQPIVSQLQSQQYSQQQMNPSYMNSQQSSQENFFSRPTFNGPIKGFKRTHHTSRQIPARMSQKRPMENLSQNSVEENYFSKLMSSLEDIIAEQIKKKEQKQNDQLLNTLIQQSQQQQQIIQQFQKQSNNSQNQNNANNAANQGEKKKKTRRRTKKRTANVAGLNNSLSVDENSMMSDESQESVSRSVQNSQQARNIQVQNTFQAPQGFKSQDNYYNQKKGMKIFDKQTQKLTNQHERTTTTTFAKANSQQPHFTNNNQTLKQDNNNKMHQQTHPFKQVNVNHQKEQDHHQTHQLATTTSSTTSISANNKLIQPLNQTISSLNYSNNSSTTGTSFNNNNNNNLGSSSNQEAHNKPTIKFTTVGPAPANQQHPERIQISNPNNQQQLQSNQPQNSLTALNQHLMKKSLQQTSNQLTSNSIQQAVQLQNQQQPNLSQNSQTLSISHSRAQMLLQDSQPQFSQELTATSNTNTQETNKIMGIRDITTRKIDSNTSNTSNHRLHPSLAFKNQSKVSDMDLEHPFNQRPFLSSNNTNTNNNSINNNNLQTNPSQERHLLTDLSKSGRVNQEKTNNFLSLRGEIKEGNNNSNNNEIPPYLKEKSVRNPTFYLANKETKQNNQESNQPLKKNSFSYSSVSSREGSLEKYQERPFGTEKENAIRRIY